ncbi:MAG TPA: hypothetical protein VF077_03745, partial [Nitrospiraceae bacterium]
GSSWSGRPKMPPYPKPKSQAQRGAMYAAAAGKSTLDIPAKVGREFVKGDTGGKLPAKAPKKSPKK